MKVVLFEDEASIGAFYQRYVKGLITIHGVVGV